MKISLHEAEYLLNNGHLVAVPTETVYGLAASIHHPRAIEHIFARKGRPSNNPLIIHLAHIDQLHTYAKKITDDTLKLLNHFWPGPLSVVLPIHEEMIPTQVRSGLPTAAFRIPSHPKILDLLTRTGPLVMPSANISGKPSSTCSMHVEADFGKNFPVLEGGTCQNGLESTILYQDEGLWKIIRLGALTANQIAEHLGYVPEILCKKMEKPLCPGQLYRHYAPNTRLYPTKDSKALKGVVIGFKERNYPLATKIFYLGSLDNSQEVAENLYSLLRQLDKDSILEASIDMDFPIEGLWATIAERLRRASQ